MRYELYCRKLWRKIEGEGNFGMGGKKNGRKMLQRRRGIASSVDREFFWLPARDSMYITVVTVSCILLPVQCANFGGIVKMNWAKNSTFLKRYHLQGFVSVCMDIGQRRFLEWVNG